jgi:hypothetical protein
MASACLLRGQAIIFVCVAATARNALGKIDRRAASAMGQ